MLLPETNSLSHSAAAYLLPGRLLREAASLPTLETAAGVVQLRRPPRLPHQQSLTGAPEVGRFLQSDQRPLHGLVGTFVNQHRRLVFGQVIELT